MLNALRREEGLARLLVVEDRDRHTPVALARNTPVATPLNHGCNAFATNLRDELHLLDLTHGLITEGIHRSKPLIRRAENRRLLCPPVVRVLVGIGLLLNQGTDLFHHLNDSLVAVAKHALAHKGFAGLVGEEPGVVDGGEEVKAVLQACLVVFHSVSRSCVDKTRATVRRDVVTTNHNLALTIVQRVLIHSVLELFALERPELLEFGGRGALPALLLCVSLQLGAQSTDKVLGDNVPCALRGLHYDIVEPLVDRDGEVRGDGPGGGGPHSDSDVPLNGGQSLALGGDGEGRPQ
mmetsp:Transcript_4752/g.9419  ORF Transcript_4752/g.9419 Transcript_4752/m.9419 type:complete len:294 (-) Transcript_4752:949-1830(-)